MDTSGMLIDGPATARGTVILAHGAGAAMDTEFMTTIATGLAEHQLRVVRFEFPYMAQRRQTGKKKPPDREPVLRASWLDVIASQGKARLVIGGKSLGGRIATLVADEVEVEGVLCLGYPFHPSGRPDKLRVAHLESIRTPTLILQGERDALGNQAEVAGYALGPNVRLHWLPDGDHSFKPRKASGRTLAGNLQAAVAAAASFIDELGW